MVKKIGLYTKNKIMQNEKTKGVNDEQRSGCAKT